MNSGSFFFFEIKRITSSFSPVDGIGIDLGDETHLYSWLAKVSIVLVEVLTQFS